jgi:hypothetical protein
MKALVTIKAAGKKKHLASIPLDVPGSPLTLRQFVEQIVADSVKAFNARKVDSDLVRYLTRDAIDEQVFTGKLGFDRRYGSKDADVGESVKAALLAYADGLYRVFVDDREITSLDEMIQLHEASTVALVRLTMLSGAIF